MLVQKMDKDDKYWKSKFFLLLDNATMHSTQLILKYIKDEKIPVLFTAPASFEAVPVEAMFKYIKSKFRKIHPKRTLDKFETFGEIRVGAR